MMSKGSKPRPFDMDKFNDNFDRVFGNGRAGSGKGTDKQSGQDSKRPGRTASDDKRGKGCSH